jgi:hypothetical protein
MGYMAPTPKDERFRKFTARLSLAQIARWKHTAKALRRLKNPIEAFGAFADLELKIEPFEEAVLELADSIETRLELEADILRGK